ATLGALSPARFRPGRSAVSPSHRRCWFAAVAVLIVLGFGFGQAVAQERSAVTPAAAETAPDGAAASEGVPRVDVTESFIQWMWRASGPIGVVIAAMSFYLIALVVWMAFQYRKAVAVPESLVREVSDLLAQKQFTEAYHRLSADRSFLARVLAAGV